MQLVFDDGTLLVRDAPESVPYAEWDDRVDEYRAQAYRYRSLLEWAGAWTNGQKQATLQQRFTADEVHHLPAPTYRQIPEMTIAPYRLGLTATYECADGKHELLEERIGPVVHEEAVDDLAGEYLSEYETVHMKVDLTAEEHRAYDEEYQIYQRLRRQPRVRPLARGDHALPVLDGRLSGVWGRPRWSEATRGRSRQYGTPCADDTGESALCRDTLARDAVT